MTRRILLPLIALTALFSLQACSALFPPLYRPYDGRHVGYSDLQVGKGVWEVQYVGPSGMTELQAKEMAVLRASELARLSGARWFTVVSEERSSRRVRSASREVTRAAADSTSSGEVSPEKVLEVTKVEDAWVPQVTLRVRLEKAEGPETLDAEAMLRTAEAKGLFTRR